MSDLYNRRWEIVTRHSIAAALAVSAETAVSFPLEHAKIIIQTSTVSTEALGIQAALRQITSADGLLGLYRGAGVHLLGRFPALAVRYGAFEILSGFQLDGMPDARLGPVGAFLCGAVAGGLEALAATPFDLLRIRLQASTPLLPGEPLNLSPTPPSPPLGPPPGSSSPSSSATTFPPSAAAASPASSVSSSSSSAVEAAMKRNPWLPRKAFAPSTALEALRATVHIEGVRHLSRGLLISSSRNATFGAVFFGGWTTLEQLGREIRAIQAGTNLRTASPTSPLESCLEAAGAAGLAAFVSHPFDTAKTRTQATVLPKHVAMERALLRIREGARWWERLSGLRSWDYAVKWHGVSLRAANCALATLVLTGTYHLVLAGLLPR